VHPLEAFPGTARDLAELNVALWSRVITFGWTTIVMFASRRMSSIPSPERLFTSWMTATTVFGVSP
jgi:hypothetical protein